MPVLQFHNYLYHTGALGPGEILLPGRSQVYTIGRFCSGHNNTVNSTMIAPANRSFVIENDDGKLAPVVHQIDRCTAPFYDIDTHESYLLAQCPSVAQSLKMVRSLPEPQASE
jgi:hypothetical protein